MSFPANPTNGQYSVVNGVTYRYNSSRNSWTRNLSSANAVVISNANVSTSTTTGALRVTGGVGIGGNLYSGGSLYTTNGVFWTGNNNPYSSGTGGGGSGTPGGSTTQIQFNDSGVFGGSANFTFNKTNSSITLNGNASVNNLTTLGGQVLGYLTGAIGSNIANTGTFTTVTTSTLNTTSTATIIGNTTSANFSTNSMGGQVRGYLTGAIGANVANTGAFTTVTTDTLTTNSTATIIGNLTASNLVAVGQVNGRFNGTVGAVLPNTGVFTSLTITTGGITSLNNSPITGYLNGPIGATNPNSGVFNSLTVQGTTNLGSINGVIITGGTNGYYLQTNGAGGLSWVQGTSVPGPGTAGGSPNQVQFNDAGVLSGTNGFLFSKATNLVTINGNLNSANVNVTNSLFTTNGIFWIGNGAAYSSGSGGAVPARANVIVNTATIGAGQYAVASVTGYKGYNLYAIASNVAAWVTVYSSVANRTADLSRSITTDPTPGSGIIAESISSAAQQVYFSPGVVGYSAESPPTSSIPLKIYNNSIVSSAIQVTLTLLQTES
jgi:hypothetical protein